MRVLKALGNAVGLVVAVVVVGLFFAGYWLVFYVIGNFTDPCRDESGNVIRSSGRCRDVYERQYEDEGEFGGYDVEPYYEP